MRIFVFGIGGTGARVLRSLAMLLASGVEFKDKNIEVIPVIIDMDAHNGDTARTRNLFRSYHAIRKTFVQSSPDLEKNKFFRTKIRSFNRLESGVADDVELDMQFDFQNKDDSFSKFIHFNGLRRLDQDILELLYNDAVESQDFPELHLNLSLGFKGNPNIGSVVFNQLANSQQFKNLESNFSGQDRIFIISSIFGGTGSSGFPTLVKLIRQSKNASLAKAVLGAITVMPYFDVEPKEDSAINSSLFTTKTKAALSYYAEDEDILSINALYYIADNAKASQLENVEGGHEQINDAHLVELLAASAVVDFIAKDDHELDGSKCFEFGCELDNTPFSIKDFSTRTKELIIAPLLQFAYAAQIATKIIPQLKDNTFYRPKELDLEAEMDIPNDYRNLLSFFNHFKSWTEEEMANQNHGRPFQTFSFADAEHLNNLVVGKKVSTNFFNNGLSTKKVAEYLNRFETKEPKELGKPLKYMNMLYQTAFECTKALGQLP
ncbi:hypothetical protein INP83_10835 [Mucilaginibacter sp. 21P]|uniref:tubulin-like doman-containing protein n=1 Tax=Mucilaginibacter sp. 21P TaxID=2778902 RepID=UPI001C5846EF|nr:tubulin-like doman-containing protein [Mucilaginibacter sp. 21P]QXV63613.1 hypothetical protein INP83_10835 [Mucilaginibacter sp. 21P]